MLSRNSRRRWKNVKNILGTQFALPKSVHLNSKNTYSYTDVFRNGNVQEARFDICI